MENRHSGEKSEKVDSEMPPEAEANAPRSKWPKGVFIERKAGDRLGLSNKAMVPVTEIALRRLSRGKRKVSRILGTRSCFHHKHQSFNSPIYCGLTHGGEQIEETGQYQVNAEVIDIRLE